MFNTLPSKICIRIFSHLGSEARTLFSKIADKNSLLLRAEYHAYRFLEDIEHESSVITKETANFIFKYCQPNAEEINSLPCEYLYMLSDYPEVLQNIYSEYSSETCAYLSTIFGKIVSSGNVPFIEHALQLAMNLPLESRFSTISKILMTEHYSMLYSYPKHLEETITYLSETYYYGYTDLFETIILNTDLKFIIFTRSYFCDFQKIPTLRGSVENVIIGYRHVNKSINVLEHLHRNKDYWLVLLMFAASEIAAKLESGAITFEPYLKMLLDNPEVLECFLTYESFFKYVCSYVSKYIKLMNIKDHVEYSKHSQLKQLVDKLLKHITFEKINKLF